MPYVAVSNSPIRVRRTTDPGFGGGIGAPGDPGYGHPEGGHPGHDLPGGGYPSHGLPGGGQIDNELPGGGDISTLPMPPPGIWPPPSVNHPWRPIPPDASTKPPPGAVWPPLVPPNSIPDGEFWVIAGIPGIGWRYIAVDLSLQVDNTLPSGGRPDNTLPPTGTPKS